MAESLRDQLAAAYDEVTEGQEPEAPKAEPQAPPAAESLSQEAEKPGRTQGRERDEKGRLLPGPAKKDTAAEPKAPPATDINAQAALEAPAAAPKPHPNRPSSWKKEMWDHWGKLDPQVAEYVLQRENEYAKGVSTYKSEWERAKPVLDALGPFIPALEANRIQPAQWIQSLGQAQQLLYYGNPQQKVAMISNLVRDYGIDLNQLASQLFTMRDGQLYANPQLQHAAQQQQQSQQPQDLRKTVQDMLAEEKARAEAASMESDTEKYPHFATVRETMAGLLQAGLAQDLKSAYDSALRMPAHSELFEAMQQQQREQDEKRKAEEQRKAVEAARRNQVSPKTATPASSVPKATKGLRSTLESAYDEHVSGRV